LELRDISRYCKWTMTWTTEAPHFNLSDANLLPIPTRPRSLLNNEEVDTRNSHLQEVTQNVHTRLVQRVGRAGVTHGTTLHPLVPSKFIQG